MIIAQVSLRLAAIKVTLKCAVLSHSTMPQMSQVLRERAIGIVGERFADVNVVDRVAHGGGGVMVWAGLCYGQRTQVHFIDGILNAQRNRDKILRPIVVPFIHNHHLMLQHDNARPHVARICTQFLEAENIPVLA